MNIRKGVFFLLDSAKGGKIKKHLKNIDQINSDKTGELQKKYLNRIMQYTCENIPFYKGIDSGNIKNFPVMNKSIYNENKSAVVNPQYDLNKLHFTSTSGSSGVPFKTYQDTNKRKRNNADLITLLSSFDFETGEKYVFIRSWVSLYKLSKLKMLKQNFIAIDVNTFDDNKKEELRRLLHRDKKIKAIISYGSALEDFISYLENKDDNMTDTNLKLISSSADALSDSTKVRLEKMFGCPVTNRYSNEECGILGNTKAGTREFTLNTASYYFELLDLEEDKPVNPGEIGRIVVTDLFNRAMPLIRYDLGDLGISNDDGKCVKSLISLQGRMDDVLKSSDDVVISSVMLSTYMQEFHYIERYQLRKNKDGSIEMLIVSKRDEFTEVVKTLKKIFGDKYDITVKKVQEIPREKTGKYKEIKVMK